MIGRSFSVRKRAILSAMDCFKLSHFEEYRYAVVVVHVTKKVNEEHAWQVEYG